MGHTIIPDRAHDRLQQRLNRMVNGAPYSPHLIRILELLYAPEEAHLASQLPATPVPLNKIAKRAGLPPEELEARLTDMAHRGLVLDFVKEEQRYYMLPPVVTGLFEFVFMRAQDRLPQKELAALFDAYMFQEDRFAHSLFAGQTQIGRTLTHEEALLEQDHSEILDWERATHILKQASFIGVAWCACRHARWHQQQACNAPMETCLSFNQTAETLVRNGIAREINVGDALALLENCKLAGLAQIGDNVQRDMIYMCNCCACCCVMFNALRKFDMPQAVVSANWVMRIDRDRCRGCGKCEKICPVNAIAHLAENATEASSAHKTRTCDTEVCLGCGVCFNVCAFGAIRMERREQRIIPPETTFDRVMAMALERGKLVDLLFDEPENLGYKAVGRLLSLLERTPPVKALLAVHPLRSIFLNAFVKRAKRISDIF